MSEQHITVSRQARYYLLGDPSPSVTECWFALHGYGQLAGRFSRHFESLVHPGRVVVVPEALNRFYLEPVSERPAGGGTPGATWMTSEDREREIEDYVRYLDLLRGEIEARCTVVPAVTVLGFSQGAATASRWAARGAMRVARVILWGGQPAPDVVAQGADALRGARLTFVVGEQDPYATPARVEAELAMLRARGLEHDAVTFPGAHTMHAETLSALASGR